VAFVSAALALLALPLPVMFGLAALGLAAGLLSPIDNLMNRQLGGMWPAPVPLKSFSP
jgi:hypothetical protein